MFAIPPDFWYDGHMRHCTAITKKGKICPIQVEDWRIESLCHVHDPNGKFRQQVKSKDFSKPTNEKKPKAPVKCLHTWYVRQAGVQCTRCLLVY